VTRRTPLALTLATCLAPTHALADDEVIHRLAWLAGCWEQGVGESLTQEQWMAPRGGTMMGMSRTVSNGATVAFEFLRIEERNGRLFYIANPSGQPEAEFAQSDLSDSSVTFSDPTHDFPQRIQYRLLEDGSIMARIEGESQGETRGVDFPMRRGRCEKTQLE
jgi:hypothetical protein